MIVQWQVFKNLSVSVNTLLMENWQVGNYEVTFVIGLENGNTGNMFFFPWEHVSLDFNKDFFFCV